MQPPRGSGRVTHGTHRTARERGTGSEGGGVEGEIFGQWYD